MCAGGSLSPRMSSTFLSYLNSANYSAALDFAFSRIEDDGSVRRRAVRRLVKEVDPWVVHLCCIT